ncbi:head-tail connector protein [Clostridium butyricum]|uniref:head-tail connector protein n=1 Tax=Clostridium butyricum TaxID=1492 RepID=UPI00374E43AB
MKLNDLNLEYVKKYLNVEHNLDDEKIQSHIDAAIKYAELSHGYENYEEINSNDVLCELAMTIIQDLYDNGRITATSAVSFMTIDRRF